MAELHLHHNSVDTVELILAMKDKVRVTGSPRHFLGGMRM